MIEKRWLTKKEKELLEPHTSPFEDMELFVRESSEKELDELTAACRACTEVNCGWSTYYAAQYLLRAIATETGLRRRRAATAVEASQ